MDLNSLKDQVSNLTLYDIKAGVRKVQNGISVDQIFDVRA
jgi:epsin